MIRTYLVTYQIAGQTKNYVTRCVTQPRYNTNFESLRQMISIKRGVKLEQIEIYEVKFLGMEDGEDRRDDSDSVTVISIEGPNYGAIQM